MIDWTAQKVVILGAARQGLALARYLAVHGAQVILSDRCPAAELQPAIESLAGLQVEWVCGGHPIEILTGAHMLCPSGGVSLDLPLIAEARRRGIPLSNDSQIFLAAAPCRVVGITGSAGKTTTTSLVGLVGQAHVQDGLAYPSQSSCLPAPGVGAQAYARVWIGGNIGSPLIAAIDEMQADDLAVMELSSFQLELMDRSPQVAAILNVTPNHLDRHGTMEAYIAVKRRILEYQTADDWAVLGRDDPGAWSLAGAVRGRLLSFGLSELPAGQDGTFLRTGQVYLRQGQSEQPLLAQSDIRLRGEHNLQNVLAACAISVAAGLSAPALQAAVAGFQGVPHRLELVRSWGGARWYNDSIATAPERSMAAIRAFDEPLVLLAGGRDKNLPWEDFAALVSRRVDHLILFGEAADKIAAAMAAATPGPTLVRCGGLREAVQAAARVVKPGDVVLLSPGGTSFDEFKDFEERGQCFARWVNELK